MSRGSGMNYAPQGKPRPVVAPGEFVFAAMALDHGHIYGMCNGLKEAGASLKWVYDPDPAKVERFIAAYPEAKAAQSEDQILQDPEVRLVAAAAIPCDRGPLGVKVMQHGQVVEEGPAEAIFAAPKTDYTRTLFAAAFEMDAATTAEIEPA